MFCLCYLCEIEDVTMCFFFFQAEDGIRDLVRSRGLGDVYKRQPGAYPGIDSEERGISESIAQNLAVMSRLRTPIILSLIHI